MSSPGLLPPDVVRIVEVLLQDGLQSYDTFVPMDRKVVLVNRLAKTGVDAIEVSSFAYPDAVSILRARRCSPISTAVRLSTALVSNVYGIDHAIDADVDVVNALVIVNEIHPARTKT